MIEDIDALQGVLVADPDHGDLTVFHLRLEVNEHGVPVKDPGVDHAVPHAAEYDVCLNIHRSQDGLVQHFPVEGLPTAPAIPS